MKKNPLNTREFPCEVKKILRKMRITLLFVLLLGFYAEASSQKVTLNMKNTNLYSVLQQLKNQTGVRMLYDADYTKQIKCKDATFQAEDLAVVLGKLLKDTPLSFKVVNGVFVINKTQEKEKEKKSVTLKGRVQDGKKEPMPGVTVRLVGTSVGTATDAEGRFTITLPLEKGIIEFSFVGYVKQEVAFSKDIAKDTLQITLKEELVNLNEVVVTGYQTLKKQSMAGSTSHVKAEDLTMVPGQTLEQMLQGAIPGMMVMNQSGLTGRRQKIRVRGTSTLLGDAEPLWVVDGIIQEDPLPFKASELTNIGNTDMINDFVGGAISWLNPNDIQDVTVLKDASATAIYGVKAANGVIVITTKKGEKGRMSISYSGSFSTSTKISYDKMNLMNSKERVDFSREIYETGGLLEEQSLGYLYYAMKYKLREISLEDFSREVKKMEAANTNWFDLLFRNPFSHSHSISISGGSNRASFRASFGYSDVKNTAIGNGKTSYTGNLSTSATFWDRLVTSFTLSGSMNKTTAFGITDPYNYASKTSRAISCYDEKGEYVFYPVNGYKYNYLHEQRNSGNENTVYSVNSSLNIRFNIWDELVFQTLFGFNFSSTHGEIYFSEHTNRITQIRGYEYHTIDPATNALRQDGVLPHGGELTQKENRNQNYTWRNMLEWNKNLGRHGISLMIGQEVRGTREEGSSWTHYGYLPDHGKSFATVPPTQYAGTAPNPYAIVYPTISDQKVNYLSFFASGSYMFDERYALNASIRMDASSRFGDDRNARYQPVWSVGLRWNMTREHWLENQNILNDVSLRFSYGFQGNVAENVGPDLVMTIPSNGSIDDKIGKYVYNIKSLPAPGLTWEKNKTINLGIDFSILHNKVNCTFDYYRKRTEDMIVNRIVPYENGVTNMIINGGNMTNTGWDMAVSLVPIRTQDFVWSLSTTFSSNSNKIDTKLEHKPDWKTATSGELNKKGYAVSSFWAFKYAGLNPENGAPQFDFLTDKDNALVEEDATQYMVYAGKLDPDFSTGINMNFRYKKLSLSTSFYLSLGNKRFLNPLYENTTKAPNENDNLTKEMVKRWKKKGDEAFTDIPAIPNLSRNASISPFGKLTKQMYPYELYNYSTARVVNASFLRCSNITLAYTMPEKLISSFAQSMNFSFTVTNPFRIVSKDFKGIDPEVATGSQPLTSNFTLNLNISF